MDVATIGPPVLNTMLQSIQDSIKQLNGLPKPDEALIAQYTQLSLDVNGVLATISTYKADTFPPKLTELNTRQAALDTQKEADVNAPAPAPTPAPAPPQKVTFMGVISNTFAEFKKHFKLITLILGMFIGGVVGSHWFISSDMTLPLTKNRLYTIFYGIYGALLFPIAVIWGIYKPPMWRAPLFPLLVRGEEPPWVNIFPISILSEMFVYNAPSSDDTNADKTFLRVMCGIVAGFSVLAVCF